MTLDFMNTMDMKAKKLANELEVCKVIGKYLIFTDIVYRNCDLDWRETIPNRPYSAVNLWV